MKNFTNDLQFKAMISDLLAHDHVNNMNDFMQHGAMTCLDHCIHVSYTSYRLCSFLGFDYRSAARGALLHDLFLYDWHTVKLEKGLHAFRHPYIALENASTSFILNNIEKDIIKKHMWPLTLRLPRYKEAYIVCLIDKYCTVIETLKNVKFRRV